MSDECWYKDPKTGQLYQDRRERGKTVRVYRPDPRESSSSSRSDQPPHHRPRRDSVISRGSVDNTVPASRYQTQHGTSSRRESSVRPEDGGRRTERTEAAYISDNRGYGGQDEGQGIYGDKQPSSSSRDAERTYHPSAGYDSQQGYAALNHRDPADDLAGHMQSLTTDDHYAQQPIATSTPAIYTGTASYGTLDSTDAGYGQIHPGQAPMPCKEPVPDSRQVRGTPGESEKLDKSYKIRNTDYMKFFKIGRVFATLWTEGVGNSAKVDPTFVSEVVYKEKVHSKIRRFVVVREGDRSVTCLPVTSYNGYGHRKGGIRLSEHGFIYSNKSPKKVDGMLSRSLKVLLSRGANSKDLTDPSLVNYGKVYTVETNVKVKDIGDLDAYSKELLLHYVKRVLFGGESDFASGIEDTPRQSNAILAGVGGAVNDLPSTSQYAAATSTTGYPSAISYPQPVGRDMTTGYTQATCIPSYPTGYASTQDIRKSSYDSTYHAVGGGTWNTASSDMQIPRADYASQPGPGYSAENVGSGYASIQPYSSTPAGATAYNTNPTYYSSSSIYSHSDHRYSNLPPASTSQYGTAAYSTPRNSVPYSTKHATSGDVYQQPALARAVSDGGFDHYASHPASNNPQPPYYPPPLDDDIRLPTLEEGEEEMRRRRESNVGTSRDRDRRRRR